MLDIFPVPRLITLRAGGVELSERAVKYLLLAPARAGKFRIQAYGSEPIPPGVVSGGEVRDPQALAGVLRSVRHKLGTPFAHLSLPEQRGYVLQMSFPRTPDLSVRDAVAFSLEERVPLSAAETTFDCEELPLSAGNELAVNVTVFPKKTVESEYTAFTAAGFIPLSLEMESQATARALLAGTDTTAMIVDFGDTRTSVSVVDHGMVLYTTSLDIAGTSLESALQQSLGVDEAEGDRLKNEEGIIAVRGGSKVAEALISTVSALRDEIERRFLYWQTRAVAGKLGRPIREVVMVGGNANVRGLPEYLGQTLRVPVRLPNVWGEICDAENYVPPIPRNESFRYATVAGLALRAFSGAM